MTWSVCIRTESGDMVDVVGFSTFGEAYDAAGELVIEHGPVKSVEVSR